MSRINEKLGIAPAGARARLNSLSGVACPVCPHHYVISAVIHKQLTWACGYCGHVWLPSADAVAAYDARVRERDRLEVA